MTRFAAASSYELCLVAVVIVSAVAGFYAPEIGLWFFNLCDFQ